MISLFVLRGKDRDELAKIIAPYVANERFERLKNHRQHLFFNRHEHLLHTASLCYRFAKYARADIETCVLSWLLHDFHETRVKGYSHGVEAADNAREAGLENESALDIIRAHMLPLGLGKVKIPFNREFAVLKTADFFAATVEVAYGFVHSLSSLSFRYAMRVRFRETNEVLARVAFEIESSVERARGDFERSVSEARQKIEGQVLFAKSEIDSKVRSAKRQMRKTARLAKNSISTSYVTGTESA